MTAVPVIHGSHPRVAKRPTPVTRLSEPDPVPGLTSWKYVDGNPATFRPGLYGQTSYGVRLAHYVEWIEATITAEANRPFAIAVTLGG